MQIRAWVDNAANAIGLSLYNFLNILNINQIWLYGAAAPSVSSGWKVSSNKRVLTLDHRDTPRAHATQIGFGQLTRAQQLMGIGYLYVEEQLQTLV